MPEKQKGKKAIRQRKADEFQQLKENILKDSCKDALVIWNDKIIDGHNRYQICTENGIEFKTIDKQFSDRQEAIEWIILNQFGRRNLQNFVRAELALKLKPIIQKKAKENQIQSGGAVPQKSAKPIETRNELAKAAGVSHDTIDKVEKILEKGTPEQIQRARQGGII